MMNVSEPIIMRLLNAKIHQHLIDVANLLLHRFHDVEYILSTEWETLKTLMLSVPELNAGKVASIKESLKNGSYFIRKDIIAEKMVENFF